LEVSGRRPKLLIRRDAGRPNITRVVLATVRLSNRTQTRTVWGLGPEGLRVNIVH